MLTFEKYIEQGRLDRAQLTAIDANDAMLIVLVKLVARRSRVLMDRIFEPSVRLIDYVWCNFLHILALVPAVKNSPFYQGFLDERDAGPRWRMAIDLYMVLWTVVLGTAYFWAANSADSWRSSGFHLAANPLKGEWGRPVVLFAVTLACIRLYEIFAVIALLHTELGYKPPLLVRSVINTVWHYLEVTLAFAILFLLVHVAAEDPFTDPGTKPKDEVAIAEFNATLEAFGNDEVNPLYFSFVTITTLGYGDFSPESAIGKFLVIAEVLFGFFLLLVVLQRAMTSGQKVSHQRHPGWDRMSAPVPPAT